jgi:Tfp pilus assembly protein PilE
VIIVKKEDKNGFFLSETMVVIAVVSVVLLGVFKIFSHVYTNYKQEERYNTINAINALSNIKKYFDNKGVSYDSITLNNGYADITNIQEYETDYFDAIKKEYSVDKLYLIDMSIEDKTFPNFNVILRKYINTIKTSGLILLVQVNGSEYANIKVIDDNIRLVGDAENEYITYVKLGGTFNEPGYISESGVVPTITWEPAFSSYTEGTYYVYYDFNGKILRRKVQVLELDKTFDYTGSEQTYTVKLDGKYKLEVWGAQGGSYNSEYYGGYGGYSVGTIELKKNQMIYVYVGGQGTILNDNSDYIPGGFNGGGRGANKDANVISTSGGGATHVATKSGLLSSLEGYKDNILIVSAGGGGTSYQSGTYSGVGGSGGGYIGSDGTNTMTDYKPGAGGTQSSGGNSGGGVANNQERGTSGSFGQGGNGNYYSGGGGAGLYGGGASNQSGAGGGSSYIGNSLLSDKSMYYYCSSSCNTSTAASTKTVSTTCVDETAKKNCAKLGNGYVKITYVE